MVLRVAFQALLLTISLTACAAQPHKHESRTPAGVTKEVNRCLSIVRITVGRRKNAIAVKFVKRFERNGRRV